MVHVRPSVKYCSLQPLSPVQSGVVNHPPILIKQYVHSICVQLCIPGTSNPWWLSVGLCVSLNEASEQVMILETLNPACLLRASHAHRTSSVTAEGLRQICPKTPAGSLNPPIGSDRKAPALVHE